MYHLQYDASIQFMDHKEQYGHKMPTSAAFARFMRPSGAGASLLPSLHLTVVKAQFRCTYCLSIVVVAKTGSSFGATDLTPFSTWFLEQNGRQSGWRILGERCAVEIQASAVPETATAAPANTPASLAPIPLAPPADDHSKNRQSLSSMSAVC